MNTVCKFCVAALAVAWATSVAPAQEGAKPSPEHAVLKQMEGNWDMTMKMEGMEIKGTATYKMELGGLWLVSNLECDLFGQKYAGKGIDGYDPAKKKYIGMWFDSMSTSPMTMEGDYDKASKTLTMSGMGPGMDGSPVKYKAVTVLTDADTINFSMYMADAKEPAFTIVYKRKK